MNEKSKIYVVLGVIVSLILVIVGYNISIYKKSEKEYNKFLTSYNAEEEKIVLIGREGCMWCQLFRPIFDYYAEKYEINYTYIDTNNLVSSDFDKILDKIGIASDKFGTPTVAFVKGGQVSEIINGYVDERELLSILQKHQFVDSKEKVSLNYLDFNGLKKVVKGKERSVIIVGQKLCSHCISFKPVLMSIADNKAAKIYYINYDEVEEQTELNEYILQFEPFQGKWGTPLSIVVENGKIVDTLDGYTTEDKFIEFLKNNELLKD